MNNKYLNKVTKLLEQVNPKLSTIHQIEFKNVFGAVGGYINARIFISCGKFGVALKLPLKTIEELLKEKNAKHLKYFPKGHIKKEYVVLSKKILEDKNGFRKLLNKSIKYANHLIK